jgi:enediyne biosynthesis protein E4
MAARPICLLLSGFSLLIAHLASGCRPAARPTAARAEAAQPGSPVRFRDTAGEAGLRFGWGHGGKSPLTNLETFGCGCAFLDANEDGWLDVLLVGEPQCGLFLTQRNGTFTDATAASGLGFVRGIWKGCAAGDTDGDGHLDLLLTGYNTIALLRGRGDGTFTNATAASRLRPGGWGSSAGFMDLDGDGDLDLVVGHYVVFGPKSPRYCELTPGVRTACPPRTYEPQFARLYRNNGDGTFTEASKQASMDTTRGKALVVAFSDYDGDGKLDFYLGNDGTPADLMHNLGGLRFENTALVQGVERGVLNQAQAAMGADWADVDRDGRLDLAVSAFSDEPYSLYLNRGAFFENASTRMGIAEPTRVPLGFGTKFLDVENDGYPDMMFTNGHVYDAVKKVHPEMSYLQPTQLFRNDGGRRFEDLSRAAGTDLQRPILGRGLATGDYDRDGRVDVLIVDYNGAPVLLHNESEGAGHWLELELSARPPNRFAYGARVTVGAGGAAIVQELSPASSYLSSSSPWLHFGLGAETLVEGVEVRWPDGTIEHFRCGKADTRHVLRQGTGAVPASAARG